MLQPNPQDFCPREKLDNTKYVKQVDAPEISAGFQFGSSGRIVASIVNRFSFVYGRVFSKSTALLRLYTPAAILIVVGPGWILLLTIAAV